MRGPAEVGTGPHLRQYFHTRGSCGLCQISIQRCEREPQPLCKLQISRVVDGEAVDLASRTVAPHAFAAVPVSTEMLSSLKYLFSTSSRKAWAMRSRLHERSGYWLPPNATDGERPPPPRRRGRTRPQFPGAFIAMHPGKDGGAVDGKAHGRPSSRKAFHSSCARRAALSLFCPGAKAGRGRTRGVKVPRARFRGEARHGFAMTGNDDLLALLNTVEQRAQGIFCSNASISCIGDSLKLARLA